MNFTSALRFVVTAASVCFSFAPVRNSPEKIDYKKLRLDADGTYRTKILLAMHDDPNAYFPLLSDRLACVTLVRFLDVDFNEYPATAEIKTTLPGFQSTMRLVEHFTDHNENGLFDADERDKVDFYFLDSAFKTDDSMHSLEIGALYENGKPDFVDRDETVEQNGDERTVYECFVNNVPERYDAARTTITDIMLAPAPSMAARRKAYFSF